MDKDKEKKIQLDRKFNLLFEAAKMSLLVADKLVSQIIKDLDNFSRDISLGNSIGEQSMTTLISGVSFIDFAYRFKEVIGSLPYVNKSAPEMKRLMAALQPIDTSRHYLQHMRNELSANDTIEHPILGSFVWAVGMKLYLLSFSQPQPYLTQTPIFNSQKMEWVSKHIFSVKDLLIDIDKSLSEMHLAFNWILEGVTPLNQTTANLDWPATTEVLIDVDPIIP